MKTTGWIGLVGVSAAVLAHGMTASAGEHPLEELAARAKPWRTKSLGANGINSTSVEARKTIIGHRKLREDLEANLKGELDEDKKERLELRKVALRRVNHLWDASSETSLDPGMMIYEVFVNTAICRLNSVLSGDTDEVASAAAFEFAEVVRESVVKAKSGIQLIDLLEAKSISREGLEPCGG